MPLGKLIRKRDAARAAEAAQQSPEGITHVRKGPFGLPSRNAPITPRIARMISQAQANMPNAGGMRARPMVEDIMVAEEGPAMKKGGKVSAAEAVHKHERAKHKGQPLTKMAKGGSASKRADGCATKGKTKGRFV